MMNTAISIRVLEVASVFSSDYYFIHSHYEYCSPLRLVSMSNFSEQD
jgi:hypothetical protein